jgi:Heterokaryon incompatibility protein (HET)
VKKYLLVDAICINRGEDDATTDERNVQITYMKQVYEQAVRVLVWLGKPEDEINNRLTFALMKQLVKRLLRVVLKGTPYRPFWWPHNRRSMADHLANFILTLSPNNDGKGFDVPGSEMHIAWLGIVSLWKSLWWTRT